MPYRSWTKDEDRKLLKAIDDEGVQWQTIGTRLGRGANSCAARYYNLTGSKDLAKPFKTVAEIDRERFSAAEYEDREFRENLRIRRIEQAEESGHLTSVILGDPLPGRSALDLRGKDKPYVPSLPKISAIVPRADAGEDAR